MNASSLFLELKNLSRVEKLKAMQFLVAELAREEELQLQAGKTYSIESPYNSHEAAQKLSALLEKEK